MRPPIIKTLQRALSSGVLVGFLAIASPLQGQSVKVSCGVGAGGAVTAESIRINCGLTPADIKLIITEFGGLIAKELVQDASQANIKLGKAEERLSSLSGRLHVQRKAILTYIGPWSR